MIITKDNLLRHIREKKYVTPTTIAEVFETTTMIASAALSELAKDKLVSITHLKLSSTPYYYDPRQPESLIEIGEKHFSGYDKEAFTLLKESQVLNDASLSIQQRLAIERIKDFAKELIITNNGTQIKFWIWYLRDMNETKKQIMDALNPKNTNATPAKKQSTPKQTKKQAQPQVSAASIQNQTPQISTPVNETPQNPFEAPAQNEAESKSEMFIEHYFKQNYLKIENKTKNEKFIRYSTTLTVNKMKIVFDCIFYLKKTNEAEILKFYTSSNKPKIVFIENAAKKLFKLAENLDNLELVNI